jgi:ornithine cyclodeaminase
MDAWIGPGTHITAMGSDLPEKQELEPALLARATVFADSRAQCLTQGEVHHAVAAGVLDPARVIELGAVVLGRAPGRTRPDELTIADLTGVGALDAAVANAVMARAAAEGAGRPLDLA